MNTCKIQQDILKLLFSKPEEVIHLSLNDGSETAIGTKYAFFVIPKDEYFLNLTSPETLAIKACIDRRYEREYHIAEFVRYDEVKYHVRGSAPNVLKEKRVKCAIIKNENGYVVIDRKYAVYFKDSYCNFYIDTSSRGNPVMVYDDYYNLLAIIFPMLVHIEEFET